MARYWGVKVGLHTPPRPSWRPEVALVGVIHRQNAIPLFSDNRQHRGCYTRIRDVGLLLLEIETLTDATGLAFIWFSGAEREDLLTAEDWQRVEAEPIANPQAGRVIKGLSGTRKLRVRVGERGKSGGARTIYVYLVRAAQIHFILTYAKSEQSELTSTDRNLIRAIATALQRGE